MEDVRRKKRVQKICTLWTHDKSFSDQDVVLNMSKFAELGFQNGALAKVVAFTQGVAVRDFQQTPVQTTTASGSALSEDDADKSVSTMRADTANRKERRQSFTVTLDETGTQVADSKAIDTRAAYIFVAQDASTELKSKHPNLYISVSATIATVFGYRNRMQVVVTKADSSHWASHVELSFRDEYLARSDMWRLVVSELANRTVYKDQKLLFMGTIKATVKNVYRDGQRRKSGYVASSTKPIFRSESARNVLFIQMSREMWDFDVEGSGEIMFNKVINGFLPDLFKKWSAINARHLVTIVLFTRIQYDKNTGSSSMHTERSTNKSHDFYRVVVSDMASGDWVKILYQLKKEFRTFLRDITVNRRAPSVNGSGLHILDTQESIIAGRPSAAAEGNILEAIALASAQYAKDYIDRDLVRTGISIVVVTAGTGMFDVDYSLLKLTTDTLVGSGIGLDLVSLSPMPLHSVPLFRYRNPGFSETSLSSALSRSYMSSDTTTASTNGVVDSEDGYSYAMPHWISISFWTGLPVDDTAVKKLLQHKRGKLKQKYGQNTPFNLRCRLHELQMMGISENEMSSICIEFMHDGELHPWQRLKNEITGLPVTKVDRTYLKKLDKHWMDIHDQDVFAVERGTNLPKVMLSDRVEVTEPETEGEESIAPKKASLQKLHAPQSGRSSFLDWSFRGRMSSRTTDIRRKMSNASLASTTDGVGIGRGMLSRQISFGGAGFGAAKAAATTDVTVAPPSADGPTFSKQAESGKTGGAGSRAEFTSKFQASLSKPVPRPRTGSSSSSKPTMIAANDARTRPIMVGAGRGPESEEVLEVAGSQDTIKDSEVITKPSTQQAAATLQKDTGVILFAASASQRAEPKRSLSQVEETLLTSRTLSPRSALAPWLVLVNPSNPKKNDSDITSQFRKWQHVFPKPLRTSSMKWKSLCSPASVPLTSEYFPTASQLVSEYQESPYNISPDTEDASLSPTKAREVLVRELISSRLSHGFQFVTGTLAAQYLGISPDDVSAVFKKDFMSRDGDSVLMSVGNTIHQLTCAPGNEIEVRRFNRKAPTGMESIAGKPFTVTCRPYIRTALSKEYELSEIVLKPPRLDYNWNLIDQFLAGYRPEFSNALRFWRARFVLIPINLPENRTNLSVHAEDSAEELRLEGIFRLTQMWQRSRVWDEDQRVNLRSKKNKDPNPLAIEYQTRDPSAVVSAPAENPLLLDPDAGPLATQLFNEKDQYETSNIDLHHLAQDLQGERGIRIINRRWHWRLHYNCFLGFDLTSWLLQNFRDISTREDAVELGNSLVDKGLFSHVQKKHNFRDGQYFYQLANEYALNRGDSKPGWFRSGRTDKSVPVTPLSELQKTPLYAGRPTTARPSTGSSSDAEKKTPSKETESRRKVQLSRCLKYDLDPRKRSYRPEIINLHYDRLHNPDNCYHIRIDWMNVTAKLIEDHIVQWATSVERYGLRLVEVPIGEASTITTVSAFRSPYIVKLAELPPPIPAPNQYYDTTSFTPHRQSDKFTYHKALLRKMDFVQDIEAAASFPPNVDVTYSWGKPDYRYTQYIHKTGVLLVQIRDEGDFLLLANRLCNNRAASSREATKFERAEQHEPVAGRRGIGGTIHTISKEGESGKWSPAASPLVRAATIPEHRNNTADRGNHANSEISHRTAEELKEDFELFCSDAVRLRAFYTEALKPRTQPSPWLTPPVLPEDKIPSLGLGPSLTSAQRTSSQSPLQTARGAKDSAGSRLAEVSSPSPRLDRS